MLLGGCVEGEPKEKPHGSMYVWYSEKQFQHVYNNEMMFSWEKDKPNEALLENGNIVIYTELTEKDKPTGNFDDYKLLGKGKWLRVTGSNK